LKREIPQKIDSPLVSSGVSTLLRRTRSVSVLGLVITVSALGGLTPTPQAAHAATSRVGAKASTRKALQLPNLIGSSRYRQVTYRTRLSSRRSRLFHRHTLQNDTAVLVASQPNQTSQPSSLLITKPANTLAVKTTPLTSEVSSDPQFADTGVSSTPAHLSDPSQVLANEFGSPLSSQNLLEPIDILGLGDDKDILALSTSDIFDGVATQDVAPTLLAESPRQYLLNLDQLLTQPSPTSSVSSSDANITSVVDPLRLSAATPESPQSIESPKAENDSKTKASTAESRETGKSIAILPDIDLSQTIIPNDRNSALIDSGAVVHQVKPGETLEDISRLYQISAKEITKANRISDPSSIGPKTKLRIPAHQSLALSLSTAEDTVDLDMEIKQSRSGYLDKADQSKFIKAKTGKGNKVVTKPTKLKSSLPVSVLPSQSAPATRLKGGQNIIAARNLLPQVPSLELPPLSSVDRYLPSQMLPGPQKYVWPAKGVLTSGFGWRWGRPHRGIDIAAPVGTPVVAAAPGVVTTAGWNRWGYGNLVEIRHPDGSLTLYAHNHRIKTRVGEAVSQGQQIADMGSTGRSTGPHTHFELHPPGKGAINPVPLLRKL